MEWGLGRVYDGAGPPPRLVDEVRVYRLLNPTAGPAEWEAFALRFAVGAYCDGFTHGAEWHQRTGEMSFDEAQVPFEEAHRRGWTLWEGHPTSADLLRFRYDPADPLAGVPLEHRREVLAQLEVASGYGYRFVDDAGRPILNEEDDDGIEGHAGE